MRCDWLYFDYEGYIGQDIIAIISGFSMILAIPGNIITIFLIQRSNRTRNEPGYLLIKSLCFSNLCVAVFTQPLYITTLLLGPRYSCVLNNVLSACSWISNLTVVLEMMVIIFDRFIYIQYPLRYVTYVTNRRCMCLLVVAWCIALVPGIIPIFLHQILLSHLLPLAALPLVLITISIAYYRVRSTVTRIRSSTNNSTSDNRDQHGGRRTRQRQITQTALCIIVASSFCWYPWLIIGTILSRDLNNDVTNNYENDSILRKLYWILLGVGFLNSLFCVIICLWKDRILKNYLKKLLLGTTPEDNTSYN